MANHKEILRLKSLGLTHAQIAQSCECGRNTVTRTLQQAQSAGLSWSQARNMTEEEIFAKLYPKAPCSSAYQMPDYEYIHQEMQKSGVTLSLLLPSGCWRTQAAFFMLWCWRTGAFLFEVLCINIKVQGYFAQVIACQSVTNDAERFRIGDKLPLIHQVLV